MHMEIRVIVYANTRQLAYNRARDILSQLTGNLSTPCCFDWYTLVDSHVVKVGTKRGQRLIQEGMKNTLDEIHERLDRIRYGLSLMSNEEITSGEYPTEERRLELQQAAEKAGVKVPPLVEPYMLRYDMHCVGAYDGPSVWLYDNDGVGIQTPRHLRDVLNKWSCLHEDIGKDNPYHDLDIWVAPADVHF